MPWKEHVAHSLEYILAVGGVSLSHFGGIPNRMLFRGQGDATWSLEPSFARIAKAAGLTEEGALWPEREAVEEFARQAHLLIDSHLLPNVEVIGETLRAKSAWWALMQHFGAPTRLLDWTYSPYVAAYFAVSDHWKSDGAIWGFAPGALDVAVRPNRTLAPDTAVLTAAKQKSDVLVLETPRPSSRMIAQQGTFTVASNPLADHAPLLEAAIPEVRPDDPRRFKVIVPASAKPRMLHQLKLMNLTAASLFPGIDGLGRSIGESIRLRHHR